MRMTGVAPAPDDPERSLAPSGRSNVVSPDGGDTPTVDDAVGDALMQARARWDEARDPRALRRALLDLLRGLDEEG
jgi:hypothetical protein